MTIIYLLISISLQAFQVNGNLKETVDGYYGQAFQTRNYHPILLEVNWSDAFGLCRFYGLELYNTIQSSSFKNILFQNRIYLKNQLWPVGRHVWVGVVSNATMALMVDSPSSCKEITDSLRVFDLNLPLGPQQCLALNMSGSTYEDLLFWTHCSDLNDFLCQCLTYGNVTVEEFKERQLSIYSFDSSNLSLLEQFSDENKENCRKRVELQLDVFASDYNVNTSVCSTYRLGNLNVPVNILLLFSDGHITFVKTEGIIVTVKLTYPDFKMSTSFAEKCLIFDSVSSAEDILQTEENITPTVDATTTITRSAPIVPPATIESLTTTQATTAGATTMRTTLIVPATTEAQTTTQATTAGATTMRTTLIVPVTIESLTTTQATTAGATTMRTTLIVPATTEAQTTTQATTAGAATMGTTPIAPATTEAQTTTGTTTTRTAPITSALVGKLKTTVAATKTDAITERACATTINCCSNSASIDLVKVIQEAEKISLSLKINITNLSSYKRRHVSVSDSRRSAAIIGVLGACMLTAIVGIIIVPDVIRLIAYSKTKYSK